MNKIQIYIGLFLVISLSAQEPGHKEKVQLPSGDMYFETYGQGPPLILLHGYFMSSKAWLEDVRFFTDSFTVYLIDLTGHGNSGDFENDLSIAEAADDLFNLLQYLHLDSARAIGISYGGDVLYHLAALHPSKLKTIITVGASGTKDANTFPDWAKQLTYANIENNAWIRWFQNNNEKRVKWLCDHFLTYKCDMSDTMLQKIRAKTLIVAGDDDVATPLDEISRMQKNIQNSDVWILPATGHMAHTGKYHDDFIRITLEFQTSDE